MRFAALSQALAEGSTDAPELSALMRHVQPNERAPLVNALVAHHAAETKGHRAVRGWTALTGTVTVIVAVVVAVALYRFSEAIAASPGPAFLPLVAVLFVGLAVRLARRKPRMQTGAISLALDLIHRGIRPDLSIRVSEWIFRHDEGELAAGLVSPDATGLVIRDATLRLMQYRLRLTPALVVGVASVWLIVSAWSGYVWWLVDGLNRGLQ